MIDRPIQTKELIRDVMIAYFGAMLPELKELKSYPMISCKNVIIDKSKEETRFHYFYWVWKISKDEYITYGENYLNRCVYVHAPNGYEIKTCPRDFYDHLVIKDAEDVQEEPGFTPRFQINQLTLTYKYKKQMIRDRVLVVKQEGIVPSINELVHTTYRWREEWL